VAVAAGSQTRQRLRPFVTLECVAKLSSLRASDSDREQVAERLRCATAEGRLTAGELEERLEVLFASRTYGELDALEADLRVSRSRVPVARWAGAVTGTLVLALLGSLAVRRGHSDAAALAGAEHPGQDRFPGLLVDPGPGLTVTASLVRLSCGFAGVRRSSLGVDALEGDLRRLNGASAALRPGWLDPGQALLWRELRAFRAVAAGFIETDRRGQP
jgi:hypothetical protein